MEKSDYKIVGSQIRPWVRYWARTIDIVIFMILIMLILAFFVVLLDGSLEVLYEVPDIVLGIGVGFLYLFFEAFLLSTWGTTFGKFILKIRVRNRDGTKLVYSEGLKRTFLVWFLGQGLGVPLLSIITHIVAYNKLRNKGTTSWEEDGDYVVSHQVIGKLRVTVLLAILAVLILFLSKLVI